MTKQQLIDRLAERHGITKKGAKRVVDAFFEGMAEELAKGGRVKIRGFGSFQLRNYAGYNRKNPRTGKRFEVRPKIMPYFKVGKDLFRRLNSSCPEQA